MRNKKGQVTIYIIIAILLLVAVAVYLYFYTTILPFPHAAVKQPVLIAVEPSSINEYVRSCIDQVARPLLFQVAEQGGTFQPDLYGFVKYNGNDTFTDNPTAYISRNSSNYTYACHWELGHGCVSNLITRQEIEKELNQKIREQLPSCLDLAVFNTQGYNYTHGDIKVTTTLGVDDVSVVLEYPLVFTQGTKKLEFTEFSSSLDVPLGRVFDLSVQIANEEAENYYFEAYKWMVDHGVNIKIYKHKPYPDIVYTLAKKIDRTGEILRYNFALGGHDTAGEVGQARKPDALLGWCYMPEDSNCYANAPQGECNVKQGTYNDQKPADCRGATSFVPTSQTQDMKDCGNRKNGESWCDYDSISNPGFDYVGSRHFLRSCVDGEIFYEECRDYREEACVSWAAKDAKNRTIEQSTCRPNNWQECAKQQTALTCGLAGDCYWVDWLDKPSSMGGFIKVNGGDIEQRTLLNMDDPLRPFEGRKCIPKTPPGFKHWKGDGAQVCAMANQVHDEDYESGPRTISESSNAYCFFMGDCGNYFNLADQYSAGGYFDSDLLKKDNNIRIPFELYPGLPLQADLGLFAIAQDPSTIDRKPKELNGKEFVNAQDSFRNVIKKESDYWEYAAREYTKGAFEDHVKSHIASLNFPITIHYGTRHVNLCNVWQAPQNPLQPLKSGYVNIFNLQGGLLFSNKPPAWPGTEACDVCNKEAVQQHKPCSEYRCKSLGTSCLFSYKDGIGQCKSETITDNNPPEITINVTNPDLTVQDKTFVVSPGAKEFIGKRICHGSCADDDGITDGLEPYSILNIQANFSKPTQCKLSYFPALDYQGIPILFVTMFLAPLPVLDGMEIKALYGSEFETSSNISLIVYPVTQVTRDLRKNTVSDTLLELMWYPNDIEQSMVSFATAMSKATNQFGDMSDAQVIDKWVAQYYELKPQIDEAFKSAQGAMKLILTEAQQGNTLMFFNCVDKGGNKNQQFFIEFTTAPDRTPARLLYAEPPSNSTLNAKTSSVTLHLNEPAECKFSINDDMSYDDMPHSFECQISSIQSLDGTFHCSTVMEFDNLNSLVYVKCRDQPLPVRDYFVTLRNSTSFALENKAAYGDDISIMSNNTLIVKSEYALLESPVINATEDIDFSMFLGSSSVCRYSQDQLENFNDIPADREMSCQQSPVPGVNKTFCRTILPLKNAVERYVIKCVDTEAFSLQRNTNPNSFVLNYTRQE